MGDPKTFEHVSGLSAERDVAAYAQVREERVILKDEADRAALGRERRPVAPVHVHVAARRNETRDGAQQRRLPGSGRADDGDRFGADVERYAELEGTERNGDVQPKLSHLTTKRRMNEKATSSAPIASATSKLRANSA